MAGERGSRPTGTVTFLFTDIEGSTALWEREPDAMRDALERHDRLMRGAIASHRGIVFSTAGDSFSAAFWTPRDAVAAAIDAQLDLQAGAPLEAFPVRVRMGIHLGAVQERDGDYFGLAVNRAARLMALAHGGQVLVSLAVEQVVRDELPAGVRLEGMGEHVLRGLSRPESVFQVITPGLDAAFAPPGRTTGPTNLPSPPTSFIGRVDELKRLGAALPQHRLMTLVGPGGVGKTRLAIEAAAATAEEFPDGTWLVELAPVAEPAAVLHAVASSMRLPAASGRTLQESVVEALTGRRLLLVLDNCEHVVDAAADLAAAIGRDAPMVTILATSREPLDIPGEQLWHVAPLDPWLEGVDLFVERARAVDVAFTPGDAEHAALAALCEHLDGIPLAIELAASRTRSMSVGELASRLGDRFRLLRRSHQRGAEERQQTLLATVEWSYRLLSPPERALFERLGVFSGNFDLAAAETVCADERLDQLDVVDLLHSLVDRSMVQAERHGGNVRFRLLETLRQHAQDLLAAHGEVEAVRARHLAHYVDVAQRARDRYEGTGYHEGKVTFDESWDNLRAAFDHAAATGDHASAEQLLRAAHWYAWYHAREEHRRWLHRYLAATGRDEAWSCAMAAIWAVLLGAYDETERLTQRAIRAAPRADHPDLALAWAATSWAAWYTGRRDEALAADEQGKRLADPSQDRLSAFLATIWIHPTAAFSPSRGPAQIAEARAIVAGLDNDGLEAGLAIHAGHAWFGVGDYERTLEQWRRAVELAERAGLTSMTGYALAALAIRSPQLHGEDPRPLFREAIAGLHGLGTESYASWAITGLAGWWANHDHVEQAAHLVGFLDANDPGGNQTYADVRSEATTIVRQDPHASSWEAAGAAMTRDQIVEYCLRHLDQSD